MARVRAHRTEDRLSIDKTFVDHYRCPDRFGTFTLTGEPSQDEGYFRFGADAICYGRSSSGHRARSVTPDLYDALSDVGVGGEMLRLPFNPSDIVLNLRYERYTSAFRSQLLSSAACNSGRITGRPSNGTT